MDRSLISYIVNSLVVTGIRDSDYKNKYLKLYNSQTTSLYLNITTCQVRNGTLILTSKLPR